MPFKCSVMVVGSLSCWRHAKNSFASLAKLKAASFSSWGLMRRWELVSQFLSPQFAQRAARSCGLSGFRFWVHISFQFLAPAKLTRAAEVPFFGPARRTPIQGQKQSSERASWPAF